MNRLSNGIITRFAGPAAKPRATHNLHHATAAGCESLTGEDPIEHHEFTDLTDDRAALAEPQTMRTVRRALLALIVVFMLGTGTDEFNKAVCDLLVPVLREMDAAQQEQFYAEAEVFAARLDPKSQRAALVAALRIIGQLARPLIGRVRRRTRGPGRRPVRPA